MDGKSYIIAVDFDGTLVDHQYPDIGHDVPWADDVCRELVSNGHRLVLWTMRSGEALDEAVRWCEDHGIELWGVNENPEQHTWAPGPKQYAHVYIDDAALGCPLRPGYRAGSRPFVDWVSVQALLVKRGLLSPRRSAMLTGQPQWEEALQAAEKERP